MAYQLERDESLAAGLRRVAIEQAAAAAEHLADAKQPAGAVHEARKRSKEARTALRLLRGALGAQLEQAARAGFRGAARRVSTARDAEAAIESLDALRRHQRLPRADRERAERVLGAQRAAAERKLTARLRRDLARSFAAAGDGVPPLVHATPDAVAASLARLYRRGRQRMAAAADSGDDADFHAWRKSTKDLWYAVRLFAPAWPGPLGAHAEELHALSRLLGDEHDLTVLRAALIAAAEDPPALTPRLERAIGRRQRTLRSEALVAGRRLWAEKPRDFAARIVSYWQSWRNAPS
jgi:CHAD domain-containing protein